MVAPIGIDKAATAVTKTVEKVGGKGQGSAGQSGGQDFEQLLKEPQHGAAQGTSPATAVSGAGAAGPAGPATAATMQPSASTAANAAQGSGLGDKILHGIDKARNELHEVVHKVSGMDTTSKTNRISDMMSVQASLIDFEVTTQVASKGMQEGNQAVQTLLKGQ